MDCSIKAKLETRWTIVRKAPFLEGKRINATKFHGRLAGAINDYRGELADPANRPLRDNFENKMKFIIDQAR